MRAVLVVLACARFAFADPAPADPAPEPDPSPPAWAKPLSAGAVALTWGGATTWAYFAWFRGKDYAGSKITFEGFGVNTYAGGADKLGHAWASYTLARLTTDVLVAGGWRPLPSTLVATGLTELFFTLSEIQDALLYQFEIGDEIANFAGGALAIAMRNVPALDRLFDFRLEYFPSREYRRAVREHGDLDFAQDYSGQSYMLALHLSALPYTPPRPLAWTQYLDAVVGFQTRNYSPAPDPGGIRRQELYVGVSLDVQQLLRSAFCGCLGRRIAEGVFEQLSIPYTTLRTDMAARSP